VSQKAGRPLSAMQKTRFFSKVANSAMQKNPFFFKKHFYSAEKFESLFL
jgi:hypothetical protein